MTQGADAWIVKKVGDVARPRALVRAARELGHVPGESGVWTGLKTIFGMFNGEESRRVSADRVGRDHLAELEQMEWAWKETLRVFPVAPDAPRRTLRAVKLGEHELPAATMTLPMLGPLMQHPKWWAKPEVFDPERFSPARAEHKQHRAIYLPFGAGAHACIGAQLAEVEAKVFFHQLLSKVRFRLAEERKVRHQFRPLGQVSGPVPLVLENV